MSIFIIVIASFLLGMAVANYSWSKRCGTSLPLTENTFSVHRPPNEAGFSDDGLEAGVFVDGKLIPLFQLSSPWDIGTAVEIQQKAQN